ncbi:MAG: 40S ribosomal protein S19 [Nanoarchaeota archaeon]|nr:40S ribosomal protein S19 [Nanoarchaeota archaeon]MBU1321402.1 40S ribosomal protein S19 [Nanoarchaeota archaeon]MBU1597820.1 40S ribosomal protein S19 [Nanoarchaeota archaeon]MBU2441924.1 40S ribosomal protein S19 [Nanoarchaeota archaeon]
MSVSKQEMVDGLANELKPILQKPDWADFVKTGVSKQRPPADENWWFARGASILLKTNRLGPIGVSKLRTKYGSRKNRGVRPGKFFRGSGNIIRKLLQQLEQVGLLKQETKGKHKGRVLTPKAYSLIAQTHKKLDKARPKVDKPSIAPKHEFKPVQEKPEPKLDAKPEVKPKSEVKPEVKAESKVEAKQEVKQPDTKKQPNTKQPDAKKADTKVEDQNVKV